MGDAQITSRHNALARHARSVRDRKEPEQIFIEGLRLAEEALRSGLNIQNAIYTEKLRREERGERLLNELEAEGRRLSLVSDEVLNSISDTRTPQGIVLLAERPRTGIEELGVKPKSESSKTERGGQDATVAASLVVIIHGVNNPSNAGAILRTAEAAGATGIISTRGTTDLFAPKALRGAMGSSFRLPLWTDVDFAEAIRICKENNLRTVGAYLSASKTHTETDWTISSALVIGCEAAGLTASEGSMLDEGVRIPMRHPVESLNVAVASGIILYEAARQRRMGAG